MSEQLEYELNKNIEMVKKEECDKYDYLISIACGAVGGLIDIFLVGAPGDSTLGNWTDKQVDYTVMAFAKKMGWNPRQKNINNVNSAIGFLEHGKNNGKASDFQGYRVNYDQRKPGDVNNEFTIAPGTHHMMSLAHSPDLVGLFFSILNQFTSTSTFIADGRVITIETDTFELKGNNFVMKIMCGIANWFGHIMSDVAGSSGAHGRGTGLVIPFYEFFGLCKFGHFSTDKGMKDLSEIAMMAFTKGYDFRFGLSQAIPVIVTELSIRFVWALRRHFQYGKPVQECIPTMRHASLRWMLIIGNGMLCLLDGVDALVRSKGNPIQFFLRLNLIAWFKLVLMVIKEVGIRYNFSYADLRIELQKINIELEEYIEKLKDIDYEKYKQELEELKNINNILKNNHTDTIQIYTYLADNGMNMQFNNFEEFDQKMRDENFVLEI